MAASGAGRVAGWVDADDGDGGAAGLARVWGVGAQEGEGVAGGGGEAGPGQAGEVGAADAVQGFGAGGVLGCHPAFGEHGGERGAKGVVAGVGDGGGDGPEEVELAPEPVGVAVPPGEGGRDEVERGGGEGLEDGPGEAGGPGEEDDAGRGLAECGEEGGDGPAGEAGEAEEAGAGDAGPVRGVEAGAPPGGEGRGVGGGGEAGAGERGWLGTGAGVEGGCDERDEGVAGLEEVGGGVGDIEVGEECDAEAVRRFGERRGDFGPGQEEGIEAEGRCPSEGCGPGRGRARGAEDARRGAADQRERGLGGWSDAGCGGNGQGSRILRWWGCERETRASGDDGSCPASAKRRYSSCTPPVTA